MSRLILETDWLLLREWNLQDAQVLYDLNADPLVVQYTGDVAFSSLAEAQRLIENYDQYQRFGMGRWLVLEKSTEIALGWCGLKYHPSEDFVDLGFRFFRKCWGQGYATEAGAACLHYGFETLQLEEICAHAMVANQASIRVLEKLGMNRVGEITMAGAPTLGFKLLAPQLR